MDYSDVHSRSEGIAIQLSHLKYVNDAQNIMSFVSFGNEVFTHDLIKKWLSEGKKVSVPCVFNATKQDRCMYAINISDFNELAIKSSYGILEPPLIKENIVDPASLDVIIVPGNAFDIRKNRIGYGAGYYDKFLRNTSDKCCKLGICYDFQVYETIPYDEFDVPLDMIVTEKRIIS